MPDRQDRNEAETREELIDPVLEDVAGPNDYPHLERVR